MSQSTNNATSICAFKHRLNSTLIDVTSLYLGGKHIGQIYHARLRTYCSSLNHHLYSKNVTDNPLCVCGRIETTKQCLSECNRFNELCQELMQEISPLCEPTLNTLSYGNRELLVRVISTFISVLEFLIKTKRFK